MEETTDGAGRLVAELAHSHWSVLYRMAYNVLGEPAAAELATSEGLLESWRFFCKSPRGCSGEAGRLLGYAARTIKATALEVARRSSRHPKLIDTRSTSRVPDSALRAGLAQLPPDEELCLLLHLFEGYGFREMARLLDIKQETASARYHRAIRKLQALAGDEDEQAA